MKIVILAESWLFQSHRGHAIEEGLIYPFHSHVGRSVIGQGWSSLER